MQIETPMRYHHPTIRNAEMKLESTTPRAGEDASNWSSGIPLIAVGNGAPTGNGLVVSYTYYMIQQSQLLGIYLRKQTKKPLRVM
jgi:hypothetical protein